MKRHDLLFVSLVVCLLAGTLLSCTRKAKDESKTITVTIAPLAFLTEKLPETTTASKHLFPTAAVRKLMNPPRSSWYASVTAGSIFM